MQLRRALLLFAIVLGLAAVAASIAPPPEEGRDDEQPQSAPEAPAPSPREPAPASGAVSFDAGREAPSRRRIAAGEPATVTVEVDAPGQVEIAGLGLLGFAEPGTAAVFDVFVPEAGRYEVTYAAVDARPRRVGVLEVVPPPS